LPFIIHIDDNEIDRVILKLSLTIKLKNIEILSFSNVASGESYLNSIGEAGIKVPDLIITDNNMPIKSGFEFVEFIKSTEKFSPITVLMLSSSSLDKDIKKAYALGVDSYLTKPINSIGVKHIENLLAGNKL
jgi:CheY-like chemotaxis protein